MFLIDFDLLFLSETDFALKFYSLYKEIRYSSNQKINFWINLGLLDWQFEITLVISDIKYFLYGTNFSLLTF